MHDTYISELHALWTVDSAIYGCLRCYTYDLYRRNWSCPSICRCYLLMLWTYGTCHRILMDILGILQLSIAGFCKWWWRLLWSTQFPQKAFCKFVTVTATQLFMYARVELRSLVFNPQKTRTIFDIFELCHIWVGAQVYAGAISWCFKSTGLHTDSGWPLLPGNWCISMFARQTFAFRSRALPFQLSFFFFVPLCRWSWGE